MNDLKNKILEVIRAHQPLVASLATVAEDGRPWVRYVTPDVADDLTMTVATWLPSRKVAQIRANPEVHLACGSTDMSKPGSYLQIEARAEIVTDDAAKQAHWSDGLSAYFDGPDDPNYALLSIVPYRIEIAGMTDMGKEVWEA
ncbi:MAG: pyridoxamine 5'-phosphate oxidase family protein [Candidatus Bipolaricaulota bacterium]|nr:MAG: pyridoxamine 5'-phosphate oxidase family protein [Candidatus Bipolaricaulota bacterium]